MYACIQILLHFEDCKTSINPVVFSFVSRRKMRIPTAQRDHQISILTGISLLSTVHESVETSHDSSAHMSPPPAVLHRNRTRTNNNNNNSLLHRAELTFFDTHNTQQAASNSNNNNNNRSIPNMNSSTYGRALERNN